MADNNRSRGPQVRRGFGHGAGMPMEKAKNFRAAMRGLAGYLGAEKALVALVFLIAGGSTVLAVFAPRLLGTATDEVFAGMLRMNAGTGGIDFAAIGRTMLKLIALHLSSILAGCIQGFIMAGVSMRITYRMRRELSEKIHRLPPSFFDKSSPGDVLSRITNDVESIVNTLSGGLSGIIMSCAAVVGIIVMMLGISPLLTLVAVLVLPSSSLVVTAIIKRSQKHFKAQQENLGRLNGHIEEMFSNHAVVKAFNGEAASRAAFEVHNEALYRSGWKANFLSGIMWPIIGFITNVGYVAIVVTGGILALGGGLSIGGIQAFIQYTRQFGQPMAQLAGAAGILQQTAAAAERIFAFLAEPEESPEPAESAEGQPVEGRISFRDVRFGYSPETPVIKGFSAEVKPGQKIAIVGQTGAGKTTIVKLLMRFYDIDSGSILLDGRELREYTRSGLRSHFGMVLQETWLFNGSVADNIRYGRLSASDDEIREAAKAAQADHFIRTLPDGYAMVINEDADNISSGQKQLLTIARTILCDPGILILDEATSNIDTRTELLIRQAMDRLMQGRTCFIIAHRLSTIRSADLILVMENGDIVEQGTHDSLLAREGTYAALYRSQFVGNAPSSVG